LTTHTMLVPGEPRHTVHDVALERAPAEAAAGAVRELARAHAKEALQVLIDVMANEEATDSTRVTAAIAVLDRACGKPTTASDEDDAHHAPQLETIRRIIVDPQHTEGRSDEPGLHATPETGPV